MATAQHPNAVRNAFAQPMRELDAGHPHTAHFECIDRGCVVWMGPAPVAGLQKRRRGEKVDRPVAANIFFRARPSIFNAMPRDSMGLLAEQTTGKQESTEDLSLALGGPLYRLLLRCELIEPPLGHLGWRMAVITGIAWLPLLVLTTFGGNLASGVEVPVLHDGEVQARLLFALTLLIISEVVVYVRMQSLTAQFLERQIVTERSAHLQRRARPQFA